MGTFLSVLQKPSQHFPHHAEYCPEAEAEEPRVLMELLEISQLDIFSLLAWAWFHLPVNPAPGGSVEVSQGGEGGSDLGEIHQTVLLQAADQLAGPGGEIFQHQQQPATTRRPPDVNSKITLYLALYSDNLWLQSCSDLITEG